MSVSTTLAHAAIQSLQSALANVQNMLGDTEIIEWEIIKAIESLEGRLSGDGDEDN